MKKKPNRNKRISFSRLVTEVARPHKDLHRQDVEEVMKFLRNQIIEALAEGKRVELRGFGSFSRRQRTGYMGRNPRDGTTLYISHRSVLHFKAGRELRKRVDPR